MTESTTPSFVPASLVRIRCFLNRRGMKVKPWLGPNEVLAAFHTAIRSQTRNASFWSELEELLGNLAEDMNQRLGARGFVVENELLDRSVHANLLSEIRRTLETAYEPKETLHGLALRMKQPAAALLLMLAAAIVVGCGGETMGTESTANGGNTSTGGTSHAGNGGTAAGGSAGQGGVTINLTGITFGGSTSVGPSCPNPGATSGLDPKNFANCNPALVAALIPYDIHSRSGQQLLECACLLNDAWQTGLANLFAGKDCNQISDYFACCGIAPLCAPKSANLPTDFNANLLIDNSCCLIYLGVRCD